MAEARTTADGDVAQAAEPSGDAAMEDAPADGPSGVLVGEHHSSTAWTVLISKPGGA